METFISLEGLPPFHSFLEIEGDQVVDFWVHKTTIIGSDLIKGEQKTLGDGSKILSFTTTKEDDSYHKKFHPDSYLVKALLFDPSGKAIGVKAYNWKKQGKGWRKESLKRIENNKRRKT